MRVLVQWSQRTPGDWLDIPAVAWRELPKRRLPNGRELGGEDEEPGYIYDLNIQGVRFSGHDHYAVRSLGDYAEVTVWNDDPEDADADRFFAMVWTFRPLAPDPRLRGAINTRQSVVVYGNQWAYDYFASTGVPVLPWATFSEPAAEFVRHGIWLRDDDAEAHRAAQSVRGWREWGGHLPAEELDESGSVRTQRDLGRFLKPLGTRTYYQRDTNLAVGWTAADQENEFAVATGTSTTETVSVPGEANDRVCWAFTTPANEPNSVEWPNGAYHFQGDITAIGADLSVLFTFDLISPDAATLSQSNDQVEARHTGTGLKLGSFTGGWGAGIPGDAAYRFGSRIEVSNTNMMSENMTIRVNTSDSYADGPWAGAAAASLVPPRRDSAILDHRQLDPWPGRVT